MRREGDQGDRGSPDTTRSREIRPFQVWLMPAGKVNECNCAGTSPFLFFRLLFHFSRFLSFFPFREPVSLFFLTTESSNPSPLSCPAIAVNLSVHARIRRVVRSNQESSSQSRANFLVWRDTICYREVNVNVSFQWNYYQLFASKHTWHLFWYKSI